MQQEDVLSTLGHLKGILKNYEGQLEQYKKLKIDHHDLQGGMTILKEQKVGVENDLSVALLSIEDLKQDMDKQEKEMKKAIMKKDEEHKLEVNAIEAKITQERLGA